MGLSVAGQIEQKVANNIHPGNIFMRDNLFELNSLTDWKAPYICQILKSFCVLLYCHVEKMQTTSTLSIQFLTEWCVGLCLDYRGRVVKHQNNLALCY